MQLMVTLVLGPVWIYGIDTWEYRVLLLTNSIWIGIMPMELDDW